MKGLVKTSLWIGLLALTACSTMDDYMPGVLRPYRPDVHQGNVVTSEMIEDLREGMTRNQVIFLLGSPTLRSAFHENEWDYIYYLNPRIGKVQIRKLQITFDEEGRVEKIVADEMPNETDADLLILGERARDATKKKARKQVEEENTENTETGSEFGSTETSATTAETDTQTSSLLNNEPVSEEQAEKVAEEHPNEVEEWKGLTFPVEE